MTRPACHSGRVDGPSYRERPPPPALRRHAACTWTARVADDGATFADRVLPDGCVDLVWNGARLTVAGPDTGPVLASHPPGTTFVGLRFRPGLAPSALGLPASTLRDQRADIDAVVGGRRARPLLDAPARAPSAEAAAGALAATVEGWLAHGPPADPLVGAVVLALAQPARTPTGALAAHLGVSERQLLRRCTAAVGYGPKVLDRVLRFRRFLALAERPGHDGLAALAARAGYADQAHLTHDCRRLSGLTPAGLLGPWPTAVSDPCKTTAPAGA